jgi:hypothetical protein
MDMENIFKAATAIAAVIGGARVIYEFTLGTHSRLRDEYRFAKEFLHDLCETDTSKKLQPLAIERGYYALAGTRTIPAQDIAYLIELRDPDKRLKDYVLSRVYVEFDSASHRIRYRKKYRHSLSRLWRKGCWLLTYLTASVLAMSPLLIAGPLQAGAQFMLWSLVTIPLFGLAAGHALRNFFAIGRGEALVNEQQKHTPIIEHPASVKRLRH